LGGRCDGAPEQSVKALKRTMPKRTNAPIAKRRGESLKQARFIHLGERLQFFHAVGYLLVLAVITLATRR
jgi:hypothetical protein